MAGFELHGFRTQGDPPEALEQLRLLLNELQASKAEIRRLESQCVLWERQANGLLQERTGLIEQLRHWQQQASIWREAHRKGQHELELTCQQLKAVARERDDLLAAQNLVAAQAPPRQPASAHRVARPKSVAAKHPRMDWATVLRTFFS